MTAYATGCPDDRVTVDHARATESLLGLIVGEITGAIEGEKFKVAPLNGYETPTNVAVDWALVEKISSEAEENIAAVSATPASMRCDVLPQIMNYPQVTVEHWRKVTQDPIGLLALCAA